ncbi:uracil-DNA glycosylase [Candidatus Pacearchaeota archaeon]|nr:MAG: uracil-DNA glycosylase [Candidatus Pacearchaeota archaeon]
MKKIKHKKEVCKWYNICPIKRLCEQKKIEKEWVENYCWGNWRNCKRYQMEEEGIYHPDNMLPNGEIRQGLK